MKRVTEQERILLQAWRLGHLTVHQLRNKLGDKRYLELMPSTPPSRRAR